VIQEITNGKDNKECKIDDRSSQICAKRLATFYNKRGASSVEELKKNIDKLA
jgi:hypothetical protein